ncbi:hypothetical protein NJBCHELONAE_48830 [Mycobacteroides chelonae]|uniref:hypothetical protein n=1 Tax=Mycobacteroides chelonae TaxID=1774 RepID=UPI0021DE8810|nr:hypothetical protein [Mycobacteroides chelonae]GLE59570.1 hypothetical protein NJBCHELONAE_48830 [Mycobacteroides chelonae]
MSVDIKHLAEQVNRLRWVKEQEASLKEVKEEASAAIKEALGNDTEGTIDGEIVVKYTEVKSNRLDQKLLGKLYPAVLAECKGVSVSRRFEVVE